jgi:putative ABC transport system ATP-binding protein
MVVIAATGVEKRIQTLASPIDILKGIDLNVNEKEAIAIIGASGSGKTTLLSLLAGLDLPTRGEIILNGDRITKMTEDQRADSRKGQIGFIFQHFELLPTLTALENVMLPSEICAKKSARDDAKQMLVSVGLEDRMDHYPSQLSGGEQQRVAIARAFVISPKIIFADEPTGSLDIHTGNKIIELLFDLKKAMSSTLVFVTHEIALAKRCDSLYLLKDGTLSRQQDV